MHKRCREYYVVQSGWMAFAYLGTQDELCLSVHEPGDFLFVPPLRRHNVYLPQNAVIHTIKIDGPSDDWHAHPPLDVLTDGLTEAEVRGRCSRPLPNSTRTETRGATDAESDLRSAIQMLQGSSDADAISILRRVTEELRIRSWSPARQASDGLVVGLRRGVYERWHHDMFVDAQGGVQHVIDARYRNISDKPVTTLETVIFADARGVDVSEIAPWVRIAGITKAAQIARWDAKTSSGVHEYQLEQPLQPQSAIRYQLGYFMPRTFSLDHEYYHFDWGAFHLLASCRLIVNPPLMVEYARWKPGIGRRMPTPRVSAQEIIATGHHPEEDSRHTLLLKLSRMVY